MEKKLKITNLRQFEILVRELDKNPQLAKGFCRGAVPANFKKNWEDISRQLNSFGPPIRDSDGWQKVWRDLKFKVKKKLALNKAECNATGGGRYKQLPLSPLEEAVANLMQFDKQLRPDGIVCGVQEPERVVEERENVIPEAIESLLAETPSTSKNCAETTEDVSEEWLLETLVGNECESDVCIPAESSAKNANGRSKKKSKEPGSTKKTNRDALLEVHTNMQKDIFNDISRTLISIKNTLKDTKKIENEKLKIMNRRNEREEEEFQNRMEIQKIELEIKKKELQILKEAHPN